MMKKTDTKVLFYTENGEKCYHEQYTEAEALRILKEKGYTQAYKGKYYRTYSGCIVPVIVGINEHNTVPLEQRRRNGLLNARKITIK